jgi:hypothetical protein
MYRTVFFGDRKTIVGDVDRVLDFNATGRPGVRIRPRPFEKKSLKIFFLPCIVRYFSAIEKQSLATLIECSTVMRQAGLGFESGRGLSKKKGEFFFLPCIVRYFSAIEKQSLATLIECSTLMRQAGLGFESG